MLLNFLNIERTQESFIIPVCRAGGMWRIERTVKKTVLAQMDKAFHAVFLFFTFFQMK